MSAVSPRAKRTGIDSGPSPIEDPYSVITSMPVACSKIGPRMLKAAVKPPDVITLIRWDSPDARVLAGELTEGPWQATASNAIKGNKVEIFKFFIDVLPRTFSVES